MLAAQQALGPETQINTYTTNDQRDPRVGVAPDGKFVVVWSSYGSTGSDALQESAQVRRFAANVAPLGPETQVNQFTHGGQRPSDVLFDDDGEFTVVWGSYFSSPGGSYVSANARRFGANGSPLGGQFVVMDLAEYASGASTDSRASGGLVAVRSFDSGVVEAARVGSNGTPQGSFVLSREDHYLFSPTVDVAPGGEFLVAWSDAESGYPLDVTDIRLRRFHSTGAPAGEVVEVTGPGALGERHSTRVARNADGDFLVVWADDASPETDTSGFSIQGRLFGPTGTPLGGQFQVNERTLGDQGDPQVAAAPDGGFVVTWYDDPSDVPGAGDGSGGGIRARILSAEGVSTASSFAVNSFTAGDQFRPSVAFRPDGDFLIAWTSDGSTGSDSSGRSVQLRRFRPALFADGFEGGDLGRWASGGD
jgi:hypothetical protein